MATLAHNGPTGGSLEDLRPTDTMILGTDQVAVDSMAVGLLGLKPAQVPWLGLAAQAGAGATDYESLNPHQGGAGLMRILTLMRIVTARRISQGFFLALFLWFCVVATVGERLWQLRGWPINWFLELEPLTGLTSLLASGSLYAGLWWGAAVLALTLLVGALFLRLGVPLWGYAPFRGMAGGAQQASQGAGCGATPPIRPQQIKYFLLAFFLGAAMSDLAARLALGQVAASLAGALALGLVLLATRQGQGGARLRPGRGPGAGRLAGLEPAGPSWRCLALGRAAGPYPPGDSFGEPGAVAPGRRPGSGGLARAPFLPGGPGLSRRCFWSPCCSILWRPRFFCRFVCPTGALLGLVGRHAIWRVGKVEARCSACLSCDGACSGAAHPAGASAPGGVRAVP